MSYELNYEFAYKRDVDIDHGELMMEGLDVRIYLNELPIGGLFFANEVPNLTPLIDSIMLKKSDSYEYSLIKHWIFRYEYDNSYKGVLREILFIESIGHTTEILIDDSNRKGICEALEFFKDFGVDVVEHDIKQPLISSYKELKHANGRL